MKKPFLLLFCTLLFFSSYSQTNKITSVEYQYSTTFDGKTNKLKSLLKCNNNQSIFNVYSQNDKTTHSLENETISFNFRGLDPYFAFDLTKNKFIFTGDIDNKIYKVREDLPKMNWILSEKKEDTKKINNFVCNKATLKFRGRNYVAWYTSKIPIPFGPWKFYGLPGLILEIYDSANTYTWSASKIIYPSNEIVDFNKIEKLKGKEVPLKDYIQKSEDYIKAKQNILIGRLPRGVKLENVTLTRYSIELVFEWEIEPSEKK